MIYYLRTIKCTLFNDISFYMHALRYKLQSAISLFTCKALTWLKIEPLQQRPKILRTLHRFMGMSPITKVDLLPKLKRSPRLSNSTC